MTEVVEVGAGYLVASTARQAREALVRRDAAIRAMRAEGASLRAIAAAAALSPSGVQRVLDRGKPEAAG